MSILDTFKRVQWTWESHLVNRLGLNRDELRRLRVELLTEGVDFQIKKNRVEISESGIAKLEAHLKLPPATHAAVQAHGITMPTARVSPQKNAAHSDGKAADGPVKLLVHRIFPKNRHIIEAYRQGDDPNDVKNRRRVKVKDSSRFTRFDNTGKPLEIPCRHIQADFYEHVGPMPKRKGRA